MTERGEIKSQKFDISIPDFFMLKSTSKLKGYDKFKHEKGGADLFTSFYPHISGWSFEPLIGNDRGDRGLKLNQNQGEIVVYLEVDRCTEGLKVINKKLESYMKFADSAGRRFYVLFSIMGTHREVANRGEALSQLFASKKRGNQLLAANHNNLLINPLGPVLHSPKDGALSFSALE
jgi:hypothetical protein